MVWANECLHAAVCRLEEGVESEPGPGRWPQHSVEGQRSTRRDTEAEESWCSPNQQEGRL